MNTSTDGRAAGPDVLDHNRVAATTWSNGGDAYDAISRQIADAIEHCVDRLDPRPGERVLDVATGTGWAARSIARRGALVTGVDFGADVIAAARRLDDTGSIDFAVGDAEQLAYADASFDAVVSTFGVMFCARPELAAAELARVCRPGGRLVLTTWCPTGLVADMFQLLGSYRAQKPAPGTPSPFAWGDTNRVVELLGAHFDLGFERAVSYCRAPDGAAVWDQFARGFGPVVTLLATLDFEARERLRSEFIALHERFRTGVGVQGERPYLVTVGRKAG